VGLLYSKNRLAHLDNASQATLFDVV